MSTSDRKKSILHKVVTNTVTKQQIVLSKPVDKEVDIFDTSLLITEIDMDGIITYANRRFCKISGYTKEELIGSPHFITRHPDMPVGLYDAMWKISSAKKIWRGYVKSMSKDGKYYWTLMYMQAKLDANGEVIGHIATRKKAYASSVGEVEEKYKELQGKEHIGHPYFMKSEHYQADLIARQNCEKDKK